MASIEFARNEFEQGNYSSVIQECTKLMEEGNRSVEVMVLNSKAALFLVRSPSDELGKKQFLISTTNAANAMQNADDICTYDYEIQTAINQWRAKLTKEGLEKVIQYPTNIELLKQYYNIPSPCYMLSVTYMFSFYTNANVKSINQSSGQKSITPLDPLPEEAKREMEYEAATQIFAMGQEYLQQNDEVNTSVAASITDTAQRYLIVAQRLFESGVEVPPDKKLDSELVVKHLTAAAEVLRYRLAAVIHPNGQPMSVCFGDRTSLVNELDGLYKRIQANNPLFIPPQLPATRGVSPVSTSQTSGGGCYVATCVYGSYDCPQVWTLRRFRDNDLASTWYGRLFIRTYYAFSPTIVKLFGNTEWFKSMWRGKLDRMVAELQEKGYEATPYEDKNW